MSLHLTMCVCPHVLLSGSLSSLTFRIRRPGGLGAGRQGSGFCKPRFAHRDPWASTQRAWPFTLTHVRVRIAASGLTGGPSAGPGGCAGAEPQPGRLEAAELQQEVERLRGAQVRTERALEARGAPTGRVQGWRSRYAGRSVRKLSQEQGGSGRGRVSLPLAPFGLRCSGVPVTETVGVDPGWCQPWLDMGESE